MTLITPLRRALIPAVAGFMETGAPYVRARSYSDYWLYSELFASTCPVALANDEVAGCVIALRGQDRPGDLYVQDVLVSPQHRGQGIAAALLDSVHRRARELGCIRAYLTSEPANTTAHRVWLTLGYRNVPGDYDSGGVSVIADYKGPGRARAVYELLLRR